MSTPAGVNGLDLTPGRQFLLTQNAQEMATAVLALIEDPVLRARLETAARALVESEYGWDAIAATQSRTYRELAR